MNVFSIIIPVYGVSEHLERNCRKCSELLKDVASPYIGDWEIIVVFDGESQQMRKLAKKFHRNKHVSIYQYSKNMGKGFALVYGFKKSRGNFITFIDADGDIPFKQIINFLPYLSTSDIVIGSKRHPFSKISYPWKRKILSKGFQLFSKLLLNTSLRDTQSGLKIMRREVLDVIAEVLQIRGFAFDLELCFLAKQLGFRIVEAPIHIDFKGDTNITNRDILKMALDVLKVRISFSYRKTYQKSFHKQKF